VRAAAVSAGALILCLTTGGVASADPLPLPLPSPLPSAAPSPLPQDPIGSVESTLTQLSGTVSPGTAPTTSPTPPTTARTTTTSGTTRSVTKTHAAPALRRAPAAATAHPAARTPSRQRPPAVAAPHFGWSGATLASIPAGLPAVVTHRLADAAAVAPLLGTSPTVTTSQAGAADDSRGHPSPVRGLLIALAVAAAGALTVEHTRRLAA
jgi:hypothetical protein